MSRIIKSAVSITYQNAFKSPIRKCTTGSATASSSVKSDVPGLSKNTVNIPSGEVGFPKASKSGMYKNPEYFSYHNTSYFEAEVEMNKYRCPQPSNKK